MQKGALSFYKY